MTKPTWDHDCVGCTFLGQTLGGGHITDLYYHKNNYSGMVNLIARYGSQGHEYFSTAIQYARPGGHAELWAAASMYIATLNQKEPTS